MASSGLPLHSSPLPPTASRTTRSPNLFIQSSLLHTLPNATGKGITCHTPYLKCGTSSSMAPRRNMSMIPKCTSSDDSKPSAAPEPAPKASFGNSRKDVLLIGIGVTLLGFGLKSGLEFVGVDPLQAGNVVQLVLVLGLTVGWISTYIFRVSNKEMTYAQQLRDYESKVMQKRLEGLTEAELEVLLEQVEEEKQNLANGKKVI